MKLSIFVLRNLFFWEILIVFAFSFVKCQKNSGFTPWIWHKYHKVYFKDFKKIEIQTERIHFEINYNTKTIILSSHFSPAMHFNLIFEPEPSRNFVLESVFFLLTLN
jgi:hypothetical protein